MTKRVRQDRKQRKPGWQCPECKLVRGQDLIDPCLGRLPGVIFACCGHGGKGDTPGYIYFENGTTIRFNRLTVEHHSPELVSASKALKQRLGQ